VDETGQPYAYTGDNPVNVTDPYGAGGIALPACNSQARMNSRIPCGGGGLGINFGAAVHAVTHFISEHPVAVGLVLGVTAVATGGASIIIVGAAIDAPGAATLLGLASVASGVGATAIDGRACLQHPGLNSQCVAAGFGATGVLMGLPEFAVTLGLLNEPAFQEYLAAALGSTFVAGAAALLDELHQLYGELTANSAQVKNSPSTLGPWALICRLEEQNT